MLLFFSISNQINAALVSIRDPKLLNGSVTLEEREFYYDFMLSWTQNISDYGPLIILCAKLTGLSR